MLPKSRTTAALAVSSLLWFLGAAVEAQAAVEECGVVHFLENKSNGVEVLSNNCKAKGKVAVGSRFNLMPGARLWIKSPHSAGSEKQYHAICQNRSLASLSINLDNAASPWLSPKGLKNCNGWTDNKLSCDGENGEKNALYCVIAEIDPNVYLAANAVERTTSVNLRTPPLLTPQIEAPSARAVTFEKENLITAMRPEAELCRNVYQPDHRVKVEWIVDEQGQVINVAPHLEGDVTQDEVVADKGFVDCVVDVVKYFPYPKPSKSEFEFLSATF